MKSDFAVLHFSLCKYVSLVSKKKIETPGTPGDKVVQGGKRASFGIHSCRDAFL